MIILKRKHFSRQAVALATALIVLTVLTMLMLAMLSTQRTRSKSATKNLSQISCDMALESALERCFAEIAEQRRGWNVGGRSPITISQNLSNNSGYSIELIPFQSDKTTMPLNDNQSYMNFSDSEVVLEFPDQGETSDPLTLPAHFGYFVITASSGLESKVARVLVAPKVTKDGLANIAALSGGDGIYSGGDTFLASYAGVEDSDNKYKGDPESYYIKKFLRTGQSSYEYGEWKKTPQGSGRKRKWEKHGDITLEAKQTTLHLNSNDKSSKIAWRGGTNGQTLALNDYQEKWKNDLNERTIKSIINTYNRSPEDNRFDLTGKLRVTDNDQVGSSLKAKSIQKGSGTLSHPFENLDFEAKMKWVQKQDPITTLGNFVGEPISLDADEIAIEADDEAGSEGTPPADGTGGSTPENTENDIVANLQTGNKLYYLKATGNEPVQINGNIRLNGADLYVDGDLEIEGQFLGDGAVYVKGSTIMKGDTSLASREDNVALFSQEDIYLLRETLGTKLKAKGLLLQTNLIERLEKSAEGIEKQRGLLLNIRRKNDASSKAKLRQLRKDMQTALGSEGSVTDGYLTKSDYSELINALQELRKNEKGWRARQTNHLMRSIARIARVTDPNFNMNWHLRGYVGIGRWRLRKLDKALSLSDSTPPNKIDISKYILRDALWGYNRAIPHLSSQASFKGLLLSQKGAIVSQSSLNVYGSVIAKDGFFSANDLSILADPKILQGVYLDNIGVYEEVLWLP